MKFVSIYILLTFLIIGVGAQTKSGNLDSAVFYLKKSIRNGSVVQSDFDSGIKMIERIDNDSAFISKIYPLCTDFKNLHEKKFYYELAYTLIFKLQLLQEFNKQIDYGKKIIEEFEREENESFRIYYTNILHSLRVPFRSTTRLNEGFEYYADKLKKYFPKQDLEIISLCYFIYGGFYMVQGLDDRSAYYFKKSISYLNPLDTNQASRTGLRVWIDRAGTLANLYNKIENHGEAAEIARKVITIPFTDISRNDSMNRSLALRYFAEAQMMLGKKDSVLEPLDAAMKLAMQTNGPDNIAGCYEVKGRYFLMAGNTDSAKKYLLFAKQVIDLNNVPRNSPWGTFMPNFYLAKIAMDAKEYKKAESLILEEILLLVNLKREILKEKKLLVSVYMAMGNVARSIATFEDYITTQHDFEMQAQKNRIMSFENEQILENLAKEKSFHESEATRQKKQNLLYLIGTVLLTLLLFFMFLNFRNQKKLNRLMNDAYENEKRDLELKNQQMILNERLRISRDLHDEVGATLSGINMYSHLATNQINNIKPQEAERSLNIIQESASDMVNKLNDIVWLINPGEDNLQKLVQRLEDYAFQISLPKNIVVKSNLPELISNNSLPAKTRRNIYLIFKEAINNAVKYSNAGKIEFSLEETGGLLQMTLKDNGDGFNIDAPKKGNGLGNMIERANEISANFKLSSDEVNGTCVHLSIKIPDEV